MDISVKVWQNEGQFIASCPELDIFTYGTNQGQARRRLQQVLVFYAETAPEMGYKIMPAEIIDSLQKATEKPDVQMISQSVN